MRTRSKESDMLKTRESASDEILAGERFIFRSNSMREVKKWREFSNLTRSNMVTAGQGTVKLQ